MGEQRVERASGVLETGPLTAHTEAHARGLRGDTELSEQLYEIRVVHLVEDDEARIDVIGAIAPGDLGGQGVTTDVALCLEHGDLVIAVEPMSGDQAGDPCSYDGDSHARNRARLVPHSLFG